ncbi:D-aminoacyl-tRNA deacylase [Crocosphaera sp.]|uniref:D-aminoacyl-tRNA deacylase n=1 Tax=Crocosphaera sp. TaxID=2729996 RepID=UPI00261FA8B4|nr:D-aminoacyl-tRNA deacylase [Crocosphaera sp.]MDJ0582406.1 D-aminoacyl-tRNA deacylase [Crocosphaera sp.]
MRVIIQRVRESQVKVDGEVVGKIEKGLNLLVGIATNDTIEQINWMVRKCLELRLFSDENSEGKWTKSVQDIEGELLVISQFTLYGDCRKGRRPSFSNSAPPTEAEKLYNLFVDGLKKSGLKVETGIFGAMMEVIINNDGPVTLMLEKEA